VVYLGRGTDVMDTPEAPRHGEMMGYALGRLGWDAGKFEVYRCLIEYPVMPSSVVVQFDLVDPPDPR
jgi:hypothetical protein